MGRIVHSYPYRYNESRQTTSSRTVGNVRSDIVENWDIPVEKQAKDAVPVEVGKPALRTKTIDTYEIDKKGNRVHDGAVKRTFVDEKNNFAKIEYTKGKNYIRKVKENGRWYLDDLAYNADIAYSRAFDGSNAKISLPSRIISEEGLKGMNPKFRKHIMSILNELYSKIAQLKIRVW